MTCAAAMQLRFGSTTLLLLTLPARFGRENGFVTVKIGKIRRA